MPIKLIALDMDGTLMDADHVTVPPRNIAAIRSAAEQGAEILLASGRPLALMTDVAKLLGCVRYAISANGASVTDLKTGLTLADRAMDVDTSATLISLFSEYRVPVEFYCEGHSYVDGRWDMSGYQHQPRSFITLREQYNVPVKDFTTALRGRRIQKVNVDGITLPVRERVLERIAPMKNLTYAYAAVYDNLEISRVDATKGEALSHFCAEHGISPADVMAFGDGDNDVKMLSWAHWSFAMENGDPRAKAAARLCAPSHQDSGVGRMIEEYVLHI